MSGAGWQPLGRTRRRLVRLLEEQGFVDAEIFAAQGAWRSNVKLDVCRWEGYATRAGTTNRYALYSWDRMWDRMTDCVRFGITVESDGGATFDVSAKIPLTSRSVTGDGAEPA